MSGLRSPLLCAVTAAALCAFAGGARAAGERPRWLTLKLTDASRSMVPRSALTLDSARRDQLLAAGFGHVELLRRHELALEAGGEIHGRDIRVRHFLNPEGVRDQGNLECSVRSEIETLVIEEAWVLTPSGKRRNVDLSALQITDDSGSGVFSDVKRVIFPLDGLEPGSTAILVTRTVSQRRRFPLPWMDLFYPARLVPVEHFEVDVSWQVAGDAPAWRTDDAELECVQESRRLRCRRDAIPALPVDPDIRSWPDQLDHLALAANQSWQQLARIERRVVDERASVDARVRALARDLADGAQSPRELLERIHRHVADGVRYVGLEHGTASVVPNPASSTLRRGFGDCKDKVTLFIALARAAGLPAFPALVATHRYDTTRMLLPGWLYFDHMIACVREAGELTCMDMTVPDLPTGLLPVGLHGAAMLPLEDDAEKPLRLPAPDYALDVELYSYNDLNCDGSITERLHRQFSGPSAWDIRAALRAEDAAGRERSLRERYKEVMGDTVKPTFEITEHAGPVGVVVLKSLATYPARQKLDQMTYVREGDPWLVDYAEQLRSKNKYYPYYLPGLRVKSHVFYHLCPQLNVRFGGPTLAFESAFGSLHRRTRLSGTRAEFETVLEVRSGELDVTSLDRFHEFLTNVLSQVQIWFGLTAAAEKR